MASWAVICANSESGNLFRTVCMADSFSARRTITTSRRSPVRSRCESRPGAGAGLRSPVVPKDELEEFLRWEMPEAEADHPVVHRSFELKTGSFRNRFFVEVIV